MKNLNEDIKKELLNYERLIEDMEDEELKEEIEEYEQLIMLLGLFLVFISDNKTRKRELKKKLERLESDITKLSNEKIERLTEDLDNIVLYIETKEEKREKGKRNKFKKYEKINAIQYAKILNKEVKGKKNSERIKEYGKTLFFDLKREINNSIKEKRVFNMQEIGKAITKFNNNNRRLRNTEMTRVRNEAVLAKAESDHIESFKFVAVLDGRTSEQCERLNGSVFNAKEAVNYMPPLHVNCRSLLVANY